MIPCRGRFAAAWHAPALSDCSIAAVRPSWRVERQDGGILDPGRHRCGCLVSIRDQRGSSWTANDLTDSRRSRLRSWFAAGRADVWGVPRCATAIWVGEDLLVAIALNAFEEWGRDLAADLDGVGRGFRSCAAMSTPRWRWPRTDGTCSRRHFGASSCALRAPRRLPHSITHSRSHCSQTLLPPASTTPRVISPTIQALISTGVARVARGERPHHSAERIHHFIVHGARRGARGTPTES